MDPASIVGIVVGIFVVIFGGRGLIDLVRGARGRRRAGLDPAELGPDLDGPQEAVVTEAPPAATPTPPAPSIIPPAPDPIYRRTFVGRDAELETLHKAFDEALDGHGSLAMVVGEPGIGKTSLTEQLAGYVSEKGGKTLVGHCYEEGSLSLPYLAFVEAVRSHVLAINPDDLKAQTGHGLGELARIVPEIREKAGIEMSPAVDPEEDRYRLLEASSDFLRSAASVQPLLVVLEDLHDADGGTLDMLTHLARNLSGSRLLVIGTYRDVQVDRSHPLSSALAELRRVTSFERIGLRGLTQDEVHRVLQAIAGHDVPWRWAEVVHRQTEGNPLFVQEVMRYLVEEGLLERQDGELQRVGDEPLAGKIPEGLRDVIGKRMTRL
ncbi:MAG: AAA family ATPase, partial [Dehalococcoidia bacterium]